MEPRPLTGQPANRMRIAEGRKIDEQSSSEDETTFLVDLSLVV